MQIRTEFDLILSDTNAARLARALGKQDSELTETLGRVAAAGAQEIVDMLIGLVDTSRAAANREHRLVLISEHIYEGILPDEDTVGKIFRCTRAQARSLINGASARYGHRLETGFDEKLKEILRGASRPEPDGQYHLQIASKHALGHLNDRIRQLDGTLPLVRIMSGTSTTYLMKPSAYDALVDEFKI